MARAMWTGFLGFGLVNVPVALYSATEDRSVHFHQLHRGTSHRIRYKKVDEVSDEEVEVSQIDNGFDLGGGEYIVVTRDELRAAAPGRSDAIEIIDFVDLGAIDPIYFRQSYYLAPKGKGADRAYALLLAAMEATGKVGIATLVLRDKEHLVAVRPGEDALIVETMYFADEVRDAKSVLDDLPSATPSERELHIARQLIDSLATEWDPSHYRNTYRERVEALVEEKRAGHAIVVEHDRPKSNVIDLMAALEASVARTSGSATAAEPVAREVPKSRRKAASSPHEQQSFAGMTKAELLERAEAVDLRGRSKMTKPELVRALTSADKPARRSTRAS